MSGRYLDVNGVRLYCDIDGHGPSILLLHGFTGTSKVWRPFTDSLAKHHRVVAVDVLGHGNSDAPASPQRYGMTETVNDLFDLMTQLGDEQFACLGYSMGGRIALSMAAMQPSRIRALVLESASPGLREAEERTARMERDERLAMDIERNGIEWFVHMWENIPLFESQQSLPPDVQQVQRDGRLQQRAKGLAGSLRGAGTGAQPSWWGHLRELTMPVLLLTGEKDRKFTEIASQMAKELPHCDHVEFERTGHCIHLEQPARFEHTIAEFLRRT